MAIEVNIFAPTHPHAKQQLVLDALDSGSRFVLLRAGRKFRKTSLMISWLFEKAMETGLSCPYVAPNRVQAKNIAWDDHVQRILNELTIKGVPFKKNEVELSIRLPNGGKIQLLGVENKEALRGISNWGAIACFTGYTPVLTVNGYKRIDTIEAGDLAITPNGIRKIIRAGVRKHTNKLVEIVLSNGETIKGTPDHKVLTENGLIRLDELCYHTHIWTTKHYPLLSSKGSSIGLKRAVKHITDQGLKAKRGIFTGKYGRVIGEIYPMDASSITKTGTPSTTISPTLFVSPQPSTHQTTSSTESGKTLKPSCKELEKTYPYLLPMHEAMKGETKQDKDLIVSDIWLQNGTEVRRVRSGIANVLRAIGKTCLHIKNTVSCAMGNTRHSTPTGQFSALSIAETRHIVLPEKVPVYDLTVEHDHCYFAGSLLVSNCDEYDDWKEDIWPTIIRPNLITHKAPAIIAGTPKGYKNLYKLENSGIFKPFHFTSYDNPDLDPGELEQLVIESKQTGEGYYRQEILAQYEKPQGTVYEEWDMDRQWIPFDYDPNLPVHLSWDFGVNDPTSILFIQPNGHEIRLIDYYEASNGNIEHFVQYIASKPYKQASFEAGDIAGNARELVSGKSPITELNRLKHYVKTTQIPSVPVQIRHAHKFINRLYVSKSNPNCERFVHCLVNYRYPEKPATNINQSNEIPIHDEYSHAMRAWEYYCWNLYEPSVKIQENIPANSVFGILKRKEEERLLQEELYGY